MADDLPVFRVPVVVWLDAPGVDRVTAEWNAKAALAEHLRERGDRVVWHHVRGDIGAQVVTVETVLRALNLFHLTLDAGQGWADRAGEKTDD